MKSFIPVSLSFVLRSDPSPNVVMAGLNTVNGKHTETGALTVGSVPILITGEYIDKFTTKNN